MSSSYNGIPLPTSGTKIGFENGKFIFPDKPIIPFIEGDGTGRDIWKASVRVFDAAVEKAYGGKRLVAWYEVFAGEKAMGRFKTWLPDDTVNAFRDLRVGIKGPLTTPVGGGIRSLNVALRQILDLYACVRPVKYYKGIPSPVKNPERMNIVLFRENGNTPQLTRMLAARSLKPIARRSGMSPSSAMVRPAKPLRENSTRPGSRCQRSASER